MLTPANFVGGDHRNSPTLDCVHRLTTKRLEIRPFEEGDRPRMVELLTDPQFTVYSEVHDAQSANARFDKMVALAADVPYAKQPVIERSSNRIVGYTGVGTTELEGTARLEWGWRFATEARGLGYATETTTALLHHADGLSNGEMLCIIATGNEPSRRVADKVGFRWWRQFTWPSDPAIYDLLLRDIGGGGAPLLAPPGSEIH